MDYLSYTGIIFLNFQRKKLLETEKMKKKPPFCREKIAVYDDSQSIPVY